MLQVPIKAYLPLEDRFTIAVSINPNVDPVRRADFMPGTSWYVGQPGTNRFVSDMRFPLSGSTATLFVPHDIPNAIATPELAATLQDFVLPHISALEGLVIAEELKGKTLNLKLALGERDVRLYGYSDLFKLLRQARGAAPAWITRLAEQIDYELGEGEGSEKGPEYCYVKGECVADVINTTHNILYLEKEIRAALQPAPQT